MEWVLKKAWGVSLPYLVKLLAGPGQDAQGLWGGLVQPRRWTQRGRAGRGRVGGWLRREASKFKVPPWPGPSPGLAQMSGLRVSWGRVLADQQACSLTWAQFSILIRPLFESFNGMVSTASLQSLRQTSLAWLDQYCSLPALRPST